MWAEALKGKEGQKCKFTHYLLTTMPVEEWLKCLESTQHLCWSVEAKSNTIKVNGDHLFKRKNTPTETPPPS